MKGDSVGWPVALLIAAVVFLSVEYQRTGAGVVIVLRGCG